MKDYYDIYYLANKFDFNGAVLTEAMKKTFKNRGLAFTVEQFEQVMSFNHDEAMQTKWNAFCRKIDVTTADFGTVLKTINDFLRAPYTAALKGHKICSRWYATNCMWIRSDN